MSKVSHLPIRCPLSLRPSAFPTDTFLPILNASFAHSRYLRTTFTPSLRQPAKPPLLAFVETNRLRSLHHAVISFRSSTDTLSGSTIRSHSSLDSFARLTRRPNSSGNTNSSSSAAEVSVNPPLQSSLFSHMYVPSSSFPSLSMDMC